MPRPVQFAHDVRDCPHSGKLLSLHSERVSDWAVSWPMPICDSCGERLTVIGLSTTN